MQFTTPIRATAIAAVAILASTQFAAASMPPEVAISGLAPTARQAMPLEEAHASVLSELSGIYDEVRIGLVGLEHGIIDSVAAAKQNAQHALDDGFLYLEREGSPLR